MIRTALLGLGLLCTGLAAASAPELRLRSTEDGALLPARIALHVLDSAQAVTPALLADLPARAPQALLDAPGGRLQLDAAEPALLLAEAAGHHPLATVFEPGARGWTLWLRPLQPERDAPAQEGLLLEGYVRDADTLQAVAGAHLQLEPLGLRTRSGSDGHYRFEIDGAALPATPWLQLRVIASGHPLYEDPAIPATLGRVQRHVDLGAGPPPAHRHQGGPVQQAVPEPALPKALGGEPHQPPLSIRVGFADASCSQTCCTGSCSHVCVFDLETYVRRGLTHEWIASWTQQSLRAGAIAYRSYGAWHAYNPVAGRPFDLCSSACCQVSGGSVTSAGSQATAATAGLMLQRGERVFRAEYSAENNCLLGAQSCANVDLSCGNGFAGSPAAQWPCLADPVGSDRACFGHGRGMSQWGSQRWSLAPHGRLWPWISNHYYNANGSGAGLRTATLTRVLEISSATVQPNAVQPGASVQIQLQALNRAAENQARALIGASLRLGSGPFLSDPDNDAPRSLPPGSSPQQRSFRVPADAAPGSYALWVSLYLDADDNGLINSGDHAQHLLQIPDALQVLPALDRLFADGFEGG